MKKIMLLGLVAILAISVEGCTIGSKDKESATPTTPSKSSLNNAEKTSETENEPELEKEPDIVNSQRVKGLIPATNSDIRVSGSIRGRQDPFALVKIQPQIEIAQNENSELRSSRPRPTIKTPDEITSTPTIDTLGDQAKIIDSPTALAELVVISGIVELDGTTKIIVKAPEETSTRYVEVGQYLSNGRILVKRIEGMNSLTPAVVLEQEGVEINKAVGEKPAEEDSTITAEAIDLSPDNSVNISATWVPDFLSRKLQDSKNN